MKTCDRCSKNSVILVRYSGAHLCKRHFIEFFERRVKHELRRQVDLQTDERVAMAVSGGKDSTVMMFLLRRILGSRRDTEFCAITVDEGIEGYRDNAIPMVADNCKALDIEHIVVSFNELHGFTMDDVAEAERNMSTCSYCGVMRRSALNRAARDWRATRLATGLNLDDTAQSVMMNFSRGDVGRLARLGPHRRLQPNLVPRIQPMRTIPENEVVLYALINEIPYHDLECPYASEALRNDYRAIVSQLEDKYPGTRHSILKSHEKILEALEKTTPPAKLRRCECGEPTVGDRCKVCELVASIGEKRAIPGSRRGTTRRSSDTRSP
ncbi:MAG: TIGR00269 family protein [Candidatus Thermoplasmatota archaeon]|nr:TIGR00269 family protein [Candidatus Thermoplasmatota archaeon]